MCYYKEWDQIKVKILDATLFLADKADFAGMNQAWDAWVAKGARQYVVPFVLNSCILNIK